MINLPKTLLKYAQNINIRFLFNVERRFIKTANCDFKKNNIKRNRKIQKSTNDLMTSKNGTEETTVSKDFNPASSTDRVSLHVKVQPDLKANLEFRNFEDAEAKYEQNQSCTGNGTQFTVMSYNILAQDLLELHPYLYVNHSSEALVWEHRLEKLSEEILRLSPEILCLQEVQQNHLHMIYEKLEKLNFNYIYKKKTGTRTDGCAIFYNTNLFDLVDQHPVEFYQENIEHLDRENVAIIAKFSLKSHPNALFLVSTTHLLYNPRRQDVRLAQVQVLLAELDRLSVKEIHGDELKRIPIILTGDFNLQPYSAPYRLITNGSLYYYNLTHYTLETPSDSYNQSTGYIFLPPRLGITDNCQHLDLVQNRYQGSTRLMSSGSRNHAQNQKNFTETDEELIKKYPNLFSSGRLQHELNLFSAYNHVTKQGEVEATTFQQKWITVDYIFYNKLNTKLNSVCDGCLKLLARYTLPSVFQCKTIDSIPNSRLGSDHLSLAAKFFLHVP